MAKRKDKQRNHHASKRGRNRTPISGHKRVGAQLLPPFASMMGGKMQLSSWMNDRLPEMLWATLIVAAVERDYALGQFRRILNFIARHEKKGEMHNLMHSGIAKLESELRRELIQFIVEPPETAAALATLRLFEVLPAREDWNEALPDIEPNIELLMDAVGSTLWHQSQEATDCRWLRVMAQVVAGRFHLPADFGDEWFKYPNLGDQREVRPSIRAAEQLCQ